VIKRNLFARYGLGHSQKWSVLAAFSGGILALSNFMPPVARDTAADATLAAKAQEAMIQIFRKRDPTAVDRFFADPFIQHDPTIGDGLSGLRAFAAEVARSPNSDITIYRTIVDGDSVLLHSKYRGLKGSNGSLIAFDLFRFKGDKIVEHWGGQYLEALPNPSGHTQVDGPTAVIDRDKTEANRALVQTYRQVVMNQMHFDRIGDFVADDFVQHASVMGDGVERLKLRFAEVTKSGKVPTLIPRRYVAEGNFVLSLVEARTDPRPTANYDFFRLLRGKIVEHWEVLSPIPPSDQWKNTNGPF
jgi:predicted SnoaL-like aldol condensation-catalyzing enzyme